MPEVGYEDKASQSSEAGSKELKQFGRPNAISISAEQQPYE